MGIQKRNPFGIDDVKEVKRRERQRHGSDMSWRFLMGFRLAEEGARLKGD